MTSLQDNQREADLELAYLAGIMDGEGCICIKKNYKLNMYFPWIALGMTELSAIELMVKRFGGKIRIDLTSGKNSTRKKAMYRWESNKRSKVIEVLNSLLPYLRVKHEVALQVINFVLNGEPIKIGGRGRTSPQEQKRREELYWKVKELTFSQAPATTKREDSREVKAIV